MQDDVEQVLIDRAAIAEKVDTVAQQIVNDRPTNTHPDAPTTPDTPDTHARLILVPILTGSFIFVADLIRRLPMHLQIQMLWVTSYPGKTTQTLGPTIRNGLADLPDNLADTDVVVIDDILDSGRTLRLTTELIAERRPQSLRTCVLLRKHKPDLQRIDVDYVCFDIPDRFVVGYGLDYDGYYRNLPDIVTLHNEVFAR